MIRNLLSQSRLGLLGFLLVNMLLVLPGCGGEPAPVVDTSTKAGLPGSIPTPEKAALPIGAKPKK